MIFDVFYIFFCCYQPGLSSKVGQVESLHDSEVGDDDEMEQCLLQCEIQGPVGVLVVEWIFSRENKSENMMRNHHSTCEMRWGESVCVFLYACNVCIKVELLWCVH